MRPQKGSSLDEEEGVSVIITVANKAEYLEKNLEAFLHQNYPKYEVIVVDECSEDYTQDVLKEMQKKYACLRTSRIFPATKFRSTKKLAINIGVLAAQYDILLFSEINCVPASSNWIRTMRSYFDERTAAVVGYANYEEGPGNAIRRIFRCTWFLRMMLMAKGHMNTFGNGYNMAYRKKYYLEKRGYSHNTQQYLGYDSQMIEKVAQNGKIKVIKEPDSRVIIRDKARKAWSEDYSYYYAQERTWPFFTFLKVNIGFLLSFFFYSTVFYLIFSGILVEYVFLLLVLTFLMDFIAINIYLRHLGQTKLFITLFTLNIVGCFYKWYFNMHSLFSSNKWR